MSNLEQAIADWRQQMRVDGIAAPEVLDELESHLRDDVEEQMSAGSDWHESFASAVQRIGQAAALGCEFAKAGKTRTPPERVKAAMLTLAGIPSHYLTGHMNTPYSNIEPRWATYLKAAAFATPALLLWALAAIFVVPKLRQICADTGALPGTTSFWNLLDVVIRTMLFFTQNWLWFAAASLLVLCLLEWRSAHWPRYRRAAIGLGAFLVNFVVLVSIFIMFVAAIAAAPAMARLVQ